MMRVNDYIDPRNKKPWQRRVIETGNAREGYHVGNKIMTQEDFLNEVNTAAHLINSPMMSRRPIYGPLKKLDKNGKETWGIVGWDNVETTPVGMQESIIGRKISHYSADGFWVASESKDEERFDTLMSYMDTAGLKTAYIEVITSVFRTGDGAIYLYQTDDPDDPIQYEVYGYEEGSTLFPFTDSKGDQGLARKYKLNRHDAVDIFTPENISTWIHLSKDDPDYRLYVEEGTTPVQDEDGYIRIRNKEGQAGKRCQCIYFRVKDIPTGPAQEQIEKLENAKTYVGEHLKGSAMPILFAKAEKMTSLPPSNFANKIIGVKGSSDSLSHADAKFLAPPDASNIATLHIDGVEDDIRDTCMSVKIDPEIIKQGSDSSSTMKILYAPEVQWAQIHWPETYKSVKQLMLVFKDLVGKVEGDISGYSMMKISVGQNIWIPQNAAESLKMELDQVFARVKSRRAAIQDIGNTHKGDSEQIKKEWEEELTMKAEIPAAAKAKYGESGETEEPKTNPADVNNQAPGKSIQD